MEGIKPLRRYTLIDEHRNALHLLLGQENGHAKMSKDKGFRWMFKGHKIPMPVRSETWFNGFPVNTMLDWLKGNGWTLYSELNLATKRLTVYKYVCVTEIDKGNETATPEANKGNDWIPVSSGKYPKDGDCVQVTYVEALFGGSRCDQLAYRYKDGWRWWYTHNDATTQIIAWRPIGDPYKGNDK